MGVLQTQGSATGAGALLFPVGSAGAGDPGMSTLILLVLSPALRTCTESLQQKWDTQELLLPILLGRTPVVFKAVDFHWDEEWDQPPR